MNERSRTVQHRPGPGRKVWDWGSPLLSPALGSNDGSNRHLRPELRPDERLRCWADDTAGGALTADECDTSRPEGPAGWTRMPRCSPSSWVQLGYTLAAASDLRGCKHPSASQDDKHQAHGHESDGAAADAQPVRPVPPPAGTEESVICVGLCLPTAPLARTGPQAPRAEQREPERNEASHARASCHPACRAGRPGVQPPRDPLLARRKVTGSTPVPTTTR
jgi:hypothetical protein